MEPPRKIWFFPPQFEVRDLRARTTHLVRSRSGHSTEDLEEEWENLVAEVTSLFGTHSSVAHVHKEHGNCLFDMGHHGDCLRAYETAYENLRMESQSLQMAKILWLWGSSLGRLGMDGGVQKLKQGGIHIQADKSLISLNSVSY